MPADWVELSVDTPPEYVEPLSEVFHRYGEGGVAVEQPGGFNPDEGESPRVPDRVTVKAYLPLDHTTDHRRAQIDVGVRLVGHLAPLSELRERVVTQDEWENSWKDFFDVLRVGSRIVVCPTWREHSPLAGDVIVRLDPGMAFGTGHHPTTRMCLEAIERILTPGDTVLDLGCGSGILTIAAAKLGAGKVVGLEIDPKAVSSRPGQRRPERGQPHGRYSSWHTSQPEGSQAGRSIWSRPTSRRASSKTCGAYRTQSRPRRNAPGLRDNRQARSQRGRGSLESCGAVIDEQFVDGDWVALIASA